MSRPFDWAPLAQSDPLPGDPDSIRDQARDFKNVAAEIQWQVDNLRGIGNDDSMRAESIDQLKVEALALAKRLEQVIGRYSKTAGYLTSWADELEDFQQSTVKVLSKALDAERQAGRDPRADAGGHAMFAYQVFAPTGVGDTSGASAAQLELAVARRELAQILEEAAGRDRFWAAKINDATDDKLTDSFWDGIHRWIERHKTLVDDFNTALGLATTAAAIAAMACPLVGAGVVVGFSVAGLLTHGVEYEAGEASLIDLGLDVAGLASFGAGKVISRSLEETFKATRGAAAAAAGQKAATEVREGSEALETASQAILRDPASSVVERRLAQRDLNAIRSREMAKSNIAAREVVNKPSAGVGFWRGLWAGSREDAHYLNDTRNLMAEFSEDAAVKRAAAGLTRLSVSGKANWIPATLTDLNDKAIDLHEKAAEYVPALPYGERYGRWKEHFVRSEGTFE